MNKTKNIACVVLALFFIGAGIMILSSGYSFPNRDESYYAGWAFAWGIFALIMTGKKRKPDFTVTVSKA